MDKIIGSFLGNVNLIKFGFLGRELLSASGSVTLGYLVNKHIYCTIKNLSIKEPNFDRSVILQLYNMWSDVGGYNK